MMMPPGMMGAKDVHFDTAEVVQISGMALLKMLKHARSGIPFEVIGLMVGKFVDDYTVQVYDVYSTPQVATATSVETTEDAFQAKMQILLSKVGRRENIVGWYHSHPGFDVWLSSIDCEMQKSWERLDPRCVAVVVDPVKSVRGKVVIGAFRLTGHNALLQMVNPTAPPPETRETTSFIGHMIRPSHKTIRSGLGVVFYMMPVKFHMSQYEENMLMSLNRPEWSTGFKMDNYSSRDTQYASSLKKMSDIMESYRKSILDEETLNQEQLLIRHVGTIDPQEFLKDNSEHLSEIAATQHLRLHLDQNSF